MHLQKTKPVALQSFLITSSFLMGALIQQYLIMGQNFVIRYVHTHILKITSVSDTHRSVTLALKHTYIQSFTTSNELDGKNHNPSSLKFSDPLESS